MTGAAYRMGQPTSRQSVVKFVPLGRPERRQKGIDDCSFWPPRAADLFVTRDGTGIRLGTIPATLPPKQCYFIYK